jgi:hypothetical protein
MNNECIIVFGYHLRHDATTWMHYALMQHFNPGIPIIPISDGNSLELPNTVDVSTFPSRWDISDQWQSSDTQLYRWFENRKVEAQRYIFVEYDVYCQLSFREFFKDVWHAEMACARFFTYKDEPTWPWFTKNDGYMSLPDDLKPYAAGCLPLGLLLVSHEALEKIVANAAPAKAFSELRFGTTVCKLGIRVSAVDSGSITWNQSRIRVRPYPTIYHPIKDISWREIQYM